MTDLQQPSFFAPILIRASAGSGKTYALSTRYLGLLLRGEEPQKILATTFTRKAAGEIRERIFQRLCLAATDENRCRDLGQAVEIPTLSLDQVRSTLRRLLHSQHLIEICTLDSFFIKIARSFSLELGLGPRWSIMDTVTAKELTTLALRELCDAQESEQLLSTLRNLAAGGASRSVHQRMTSEVERLFQVFQDTNRQAWHWLSPPEALANDVVARALDSLQNCDLPKTKKGQVSKPWIKAIQQAVDCIQRQDWESFFASGLAPKILSGETYQKIDIPVDIKRNFAPLIQQASAALLTRLSSRLSAAYDLLHHFDHHLSTAKSRAQSLQFDDIKRCLARAALLHDLESVYYRLDSRLAHILLDEFQDTSLEEWVVLQPIADQILATSDSEHTFFCVGDPKQAIYGWRGGLAEILDSLPESWSQICISELSKSYRSSPVILDFVNQIFSSLSDNSAFQEYGTVAESWQNQFVSHTSARNELQGRVELHLLKSDDSATQSDYQKLALKLSEIRSQYPDASIGVLLRTNVQVGEVLKELSDPRYSIRASGEGGNPLTDSSAVLTFCSLLRAIDHPGDSLSLYHVMHSPLAKIFKLNPKAAQSHSLKFLSELRSQIVGAGLGAVLQSVVQQLSPYYSSRERRRLRQMVDLAYEFELRQSLRFNDFVELLMNKKVEDRLSERVRVMTVHQSKGLEFDIVLLYDSGKSLTKLQSTSLVSSRENPLAAADRVSPSASKTLRLISPELQEMYFQTCAAKLKEELSVLYVALTRARQGLYILTQEPGKSSVTLNVSQILYAALGLTQFDQPELLYASGAANWELSHVRQEQVQTFQLPLQIRFSARRGVRQRGMPRQSASGFHGLNSLKEILNLQSEQALQRGVSLHALFENIQWLDDDSIQETISAEDTNNYLEEFKMLSKQPNIKSLLSAKRYEGFESILVWREQPFAITYQGNIVNGVIDRLVICCDQNGMAHEAEVIDFKTDRLNNEEQYEQRVAQYKPQLDMYRVAASRITGLELSKVKCYLAFISGDRVCQV